MEGKFDKVCNVSSFINAHGALKTALCTKEITMSVQTQWTGETTERKGEIIYRLKTLSLIKSIARQHIRKKENST